MNKKILQNLEASSKLEPINVQTKERDKKELYLFKCGTVLLRDICLSKRTLHTLVVIGQLSVTSLDGISKLHHLRELWIIECQVKDVSDLRKCSKLEKLYLYSNDIDEIPNLSNCPLLKLLSLSGNNISQLRNVHTMSELKELYLANNRLKTIGDALSQNLQLSLVNLSGNPLHHLKDIRCLSLMPSLDAVVFSDPLYGDCPLISLCNYRQFVIYYLSQISELDHYPISSEERLHVNDFFKNKMMFYTMLWHKHQNIHLESVKEKHRTSNQMISAFRQELVAAKSREDSLSSGKQKTPLEINSRLNSCLESLRQWQEDASLQMQILQHQLSLVLQYCGNMSFVDYTPKHGNALMDICQNILDESLCPFVRKDLGIIGVRIHRVTKVVNKSGEAFRTWIAIEEDSVLEDSEEAVFKFLVAPHGVTDLQKWPFPTFENEFVNEKEVIVTDCLATADANWLSEVSSRKSSLGSTHLLDKQIARRLAVLVYLPSSALIVSSLTRDKFHAMHLSNEEEMCDQFFFTNPEVGKPVFAVEYNYIFETGPEDDELEHVFLKPTKPAPSRLNLSMNSIIHCLGLTKEEICILVKMNLSGQGISVIDISLELPNLRELNLSFNGLKSLPSAQMMKYLRNLNVSYNEIRSLIIEAILSNLENLNASWNNISRFSSTLQTLEELTPNLLDLNVKNNPFADIVAPETMILLARNSLLKLELCNEFSVKNVHLNRVNHFPWVIDLFEKTDASKAQDIGAMMPEVISETNKSLRNPSFFAEKDFESVRYINLEDNQINKMEFLGKFLNVQELSLSNNLIRKVLLEEPSEHLVKLKLSSNFIMTTEGITQRNLPVIKYLDLSNNSITSLLPMADYHSLKEFYCSHNQVGELQEMHNVKNWRELQILDFSSNPVDSTSLCRKFIVFYLTKIEHVSGQAVQEQDILEANRTFGGSLDKDTLKNTHKKEELVILKNLSIVNCSIKKVNLSSIDLPCMESLDLRRNQIACLWGLQDLRKLETLCLSHNKIATFQSHVYEGTGSCDSAFSSLISLYLDHNTVNSLVEMKLQKISSLKHLYLHNNRLQDINGLQCCKNLETLVLDNNKIRMITEEDFHVDNNIKVLLLENNKIKFLCFTRRLSKLEKLFVANNKIADKEQIQNLTALDYLKEVTLLGNPLCKRTNHYKLALQAVPGLRLVDGHSVLLQEYTDENSDEIT